MEKDNKTKNKITDNIEKKQDIIIPDEKSINILDYTVLPKLEYEKITQEKKCSKSRNEINNAIDDFNKNRMYIYLFNFSSTYDELREDRIYMFERSLLS